MAPNDVTRVDPFELVFAPFETRFAELRSAAERDGHDVRHLAVFTQRSDTQRLLVDLESTDTPNATPAATGAYTTLLYLAYHFWDGGRVRHGVDRARLTNALLSATASKDPASAPRDACYLRFPERWFWAQVTPDAPHEPLDGIFVAAPRDGDPVTLAAILGVRPDRHGFSEVALTVTAAEFADARAHLPQHPFAPVMSGGDRAGFHSLTTPAELLVVTDLALRTATH